MKQFRCASCKYEFNNRVKGKTEPPRICPYCAKEGTVKKKGHILQEI